MSLLEEEEMEGRERLLQGKRGQEEERLFSRFRERVRGEEEEEEEEAEEEKEEEEERL